MKKPGETASEVDLDVQAIRAQFPILKRQVHGKPLVYFDNAATTQKPQVVIDALDRYYSQENANIHRGVHSLSQAATSAYEQVREKIAKFINAGESREIIFTRGATESINLVAATWGRKFLTAGDEIILSAMEHHSNIVPWQMIAEQTEAVIRVIPIDDSGRLRMEEFDRLLSDRTKIVSIVHLSNSLGTVNPVKEIIAKAHGRGAVVMVDGRSGWRMRRSTCAIWMWISTPSRGTSFTARRGLACFMGRRRFWNRCRRIRAAGT